MSLGLEPTHDAEGFPIFSPGLRKLLTEGDNAYSAAHIIAINATLRAEAESVAHVLEDTARPAAVADILALLELAAPRFGVDPDGQEPGVRWAAYLRELAECPLASVKRGLDLWERGEAGAPKGSEMFFPQPHQLFAALATHRAMLGQMRHRLRKALERAEKVAPPPRERMSRAEMIAAGYMDAQGRMIGLGGNRTAATPDPPEAL